MALVLLGTVCGRLSLGIKKFELERLNGPAVKMQ